MSEEDTHEDADYMIEKILSLRLFADSDGKRQKNVVEMGYEILLCPRLVWKAVSKRKMKPGLHNEMSSEASSLEFERIVQVLRAKYPEERVKTFLAEGFLYDFFDFNEGNTIVIDSKQR